MSSLYTTDPAPTDQQRAFTVSELNREVKDLLENNFPSLLVEGEISNFARPASGHWYFTLKDARAQVRCAMFRGRNMAVRFQPESGSKVLLRARLSLYEGRGDYQLLVDRMELAGDGALQQAFEALKAKLQSEGLFDADNKQELPEHIQHIGVITSPTGAAVKDILSVLKRRFPSIKVTVLPVVVQGEEAAPAMIQALNTANKRSGPLSDLDVIIIGRGGGSLEDLWAFNHEELARTIAASALPVVSAVGHEVDFTIADFVADIRAATPSAAAELLSPSQLEYQALFSAYSQQFTALMQQYITTQQNSLAAIGKRLRHPGRRLQEQAQRLDELENRMRHGLRNACFRSSSRLAQVKTSLRLHSPLIRLQNLRKDTLYHEQKLNSRMKEILAQHRHNLARYSHSLHTVSPLATLSRGYAIALDEKHHVIKSVAQVKQGDRITTRLHQGCITSVVENIQNKNET